MRGTRTTAAVLAAIVVLLLSACGDDDAATDDGGGAEGSTSIEAAAAEYAFSPDSWTVPAGEEFTIELSNEGSIQHEWAVLKAGEEIASEDEFTEDKVLFEVEAIPAGESTTESFTIDDAGTHQVICAIEGHFDAGMEGTLEVTG